MLYITQRIEAMKSKDALTNRHAKVGKRLYMHHHHHHHLHQEPSQPPQPRPTPQQQRFAASLD